MKQWRGMWFPDGEVHLQGWMASVNKVVNGRLTYQYHKYQAARDLCKQRRRVIDVGGNIGLWAMHMSDDFQAVESFEPVDAFADIFAKNSPKATLHRVALGSEIGEVVMVQGTDNSCGDSRPQSDIAPHTKVHNTARMTTLDSYAFAEVDLIKIDCEGYELEVLRGALETIVNNKPVIIIEQKEGHGKTFGISDTAGVNYLMALGMRQHSVISGDYVMVW